MSNYREADIPLDRIEEPAEVLRDSIDPVALGELADSIAAEGLHQRVGVIEKSHPEFYTIIYGHRRFLAHRLLNRREIPAKIYPPNADVLQIAASENLNRVQLTPMEEATTAKKFLDRGESVSGIARLFRRSPSWVGARLSLLELPHELQAAVHDGAVSMAVAERLAFIGHEKYRASLLDEAMRTGASAAVVDVWLAHYNSDPARYAANHSTVEEIRSNREKFVLMIECEGCKENTPYGETRALRLCTRCDEAMQKVLTEAAT